MFGKWFFLVHGVCVCVCVRKNHTVLVNLKNERKKESMDLLSILLIFIRI